MSSQHDTLPSLVPASAKPLERLDPALYRDLLESAPDAVVLIDSEGRILLVNRQAERLFGYARDELLGIPVEVLVPEQFRKAHSVHRDSYFAEPKVREMGAGLELAGHRVPHRDQPQPDPHAEGHAGHRRHPRCDRTPTRQRNVPGAARIGTRRDGHHR